MQSTLVSTATWNGMDIMALISLMMFVMLRYTSMVLAVGKPHSLMVPPTEMASSAKFNWTFELPTSSYLEYLMVPPIEMASSAKFNWTFELPPSSYLEYLMVPPIEMASSAKFNWTFELPTSSYLEYLKKSTVV